MGTFIWFVILVASLFVKDPELKRLLWVVGALYFIGGAIERRD